MSVGAVIALIIGGAGMAIPEMSLPPASLSRGWSVLWWVSFLSPPLLPAFCSISVNHI